MIDFLLAYEANPRAKAPAPDETLEFLGKHRIVLPTMSVAWHPERMAGLHVYAWGHDVAPLPAAKRIRSSKAGVSIFDGWMLPTLGEPPVPDVEAAKAHFDKSRSAVGEFLFLDVDGKGDGRVVRNLLGSIQLYAHVSKDRVLLGTRSSIVAAYLGGRGLNPGFARWVGTYSVPFSNDSAFEGVTCVPPGSIRG